MSVASPASYTRSNATYHALRSPSPTHPPTLPISYSNPASILQSGNVGVLRCIANNNEAGRLNVSFAVDDPVRGYGNAVFGRRMLQVYAPTDSVFTYTAYPTIQALSAQSSGYGGGSLLTISGGGFSATPQSNVVTLGGLPCAIVSSTTDTITCIPSAFSSVAPSAAGSFNGSLPLTPLQPAGRGLQHNVWNGLTSTTTTATMQSGGAGISTRTDISFVNGDSVTGYYINDREYYTQELSGFFVPPVTANYTFILRGDDWVAAWLSSNASPMNEALIAFVPQWTDSLVSFSQQVRARRLQDRPAPVAVATRGSWRSRSVRVSPTIAQRSQPQCRCRRRSSLSAGSRTGSARATSTLAPPVTLSLRCVSARPETRRPPPC